MAGPTTNGNGQIQKAQAKEEVPALVSLLQRMGPQIERALPRHLTADRMARVCLTALRTNPELLSCTQESFMGAIMSCAQLGLEPNTPLGHAYLIPYKDRKNKVTICQLILGYQGMIELAYRSGRVASIKAMVVRQGDLFDFDHGLHEKLEHKSLAPEDAEITHAYAIARMKDGTPIFTVMAWPQIEARRMRGASGRTYANGDRVHTPWDTDYEAMCMKTVVRALFKWIPKSAEMADAMHGDDLADRGKHFAHALPDLTEGLRKDGIAVPINVIEDTSESSTEEPAPRMREPGEDDA